ncbi:MAG: STAS domain-containing protein [Pseudomonadota bacterium]
MAELFLDQRDRVCVLKVHGVLKQPDADQLSKTIKSATQTADAVIIDCSQMTRIGSGGMRAMSRAHVDLKESGKQLMIAGLKGDVRETFQIGGFDTVLQLSADVEAAQNKCAARLR